MNTEKWVYRFDEVGSEHNDIVGKKCAQLGEMTRAGFRVPPGYALSVEAYKIFMTKSGALEEIREYMKDFKADPGNSKDLPKYDKASKIIRTILETKEIPKDMAALIGEYYDELCEIAHVKDVPVATRSAGAASHPGQYETFLYIRGKADLMKNIIKVWSSTFNQRSIHARHRLGLPLDWDPIGVAVLKMVNAKAAGVMFTLNPANGDVSKVMIEGNWSLGESVVSGSVTPDEWTIDKVVLEIIKKTISKKTTECIFEARSGEVQMVDIPLDRQDIPCLNNDEVLELAKIGKKLEQYYGTAQDIEWVIDNDLPFPENIFLVQTRPETIWSKKQTETKLKTTGSSVGDVSQFFRKVKT
jgi:pyruvate, water dikinase